MAGLEVQPEEWEEKEEDKRTTAERLVLLGTFSHQVAGHGAILRARDGRICKPLARRELWFYRTLFAHPQPLLHLQDPQVHHHHQYSRLIAFVPRWFGCFHISKDQLLGLVQHHPPSTSADAEEGEGGDHQLHVETWSAKVYHDLEQHLTAEPPGLVHHYIVLEDLTASYRHPCLLDIKLGTRQYGDDATPKKIEYEKFKASTTTTCTLGFRVCGMKVFDAVKGAYAEKDKDAGKKVTKDNMVPYLASFFHDGRELRREVLHAIKHRLETLRTALREESNFRLYSSSLLLLYEGAPEGSGQGGDQHQVRCDVRMIDFAHVFVLEEGQQNDDGYMWGLDNLIDMLGQI